MLIVMNCESPPFRFPILKRRSRDKSISLDCLLRHGNLVDCHVLLCDEEVAKSIANLKLFQNGSKAVFR